MKWRVDGVTFRDVISVYMFSQRFTAIAIPQRHRHILGAEEGLALFITHGADSTLRVYDAAIHVKKIQKKSRML